MNENEPNAPLAQKALQAPEKPKLYQTIMDELTTRGTWADRQATWYAMRHDGLRRKVKPFPGAADLHFPLADTFIEKWLPFYGQQIYAREQIASFIPKKPEVEAFREDVAKWFDYQLKHESNFERKVAINNDRMLERGISILKVTWDTATKKLRFTSKDPTRLIVPWHTEELHEADWLVDVIEISEAKYKHVPGYKQDADFIKKIRGKGATVEGGSTLADQLKQSREGVTHSNREDLIILWEVWEKTADGYTVETFSPLYPDVAVKAKTAHPYSHKRCVFVRFDREAKEDGHYSSRGVPEIVGAFEASACKMWNEKHDFMSYVNRPLFQSEKGIPNPGNLQLRPGSVLPEGIAPARFGEPPFSFDQEINSLRSVAEYRAGMPDFGVGNSKSSSEPRTAREVTLLGSFAQTSITHKAQLYRKPLGEVLELAWLLLLEFGRDKLEYFTGEAWMKLDQAAIADAYKVIPNGSADSWDREGRLQKAIVREQTFRGNPFVDQFELTKSVLELDDPQLSRKLLQDPQEKAKEEYEAEAEILPTILLGMPLMVRPEMDPAPRLRCLVDFIKSRAMLKEPATPLQMRSVQMRMQTLLQAAAQKNPEEAKALQAAIGQEISQAMQQPPQRQPQPGLDPASAGGM